MDKSIESDWFSEFFSLGQERVRRALKTRAWSSDKSRAASVWLQQQELRDWQRGELAASHNSHEWRKRSARTFSLQQRR
jgi:hypothetical protein